jgi:hypothetical protein
MKTFSDSNDNIEMCQLSSQSYFPIRNVDQNIIEKYIDASIAFTGATLNFTWGGA